MCEWVREEHRRDATMNESDGKRDGETKITSRSRRNQGEKHGNQSEPDVSENVATGKAGKLGKLALIARRQVSCAHAYELRGSTRHISDRSVTRYHPQSFEKDSR